MFKLAMVSSILPETHYSSYLIDALQKLGAPNQKILVYADRNKDNLKSPLENVKLIWSKSILFPIQIALQAKKDELSLIHLQHEINMFGGPQTALLFPLLLIFLKILRIKTIVTVHAVVKQEQIDPTFLETFNFPKNKIFILPIKAFFFFLYFFTNKLGDKIIVHAPVLKQILEEEYFGQPDKIVVVREGVPQYSSNFKSITINNFWIRTIKNKKLILYFGYLVKRKKLEDLIEAFKNISRKYPEYNLIMAGGTLQKDYEEYVKKLASDCPSIVFTSFVSEKELGWLLEHCEFVVLPAVYSISASGPLSHAMRFAKPVIVPRLGVFQEEIQDKVDGLYYEPFQKESLQIALEKLISDKKLKEQLAKNMQKKYDKRIWPKIAQQTQDLYKGIINE